MAQIDNVMDYEDVQRFLVRYLTINSSGHDDYVNFYIGAYDYRGNGYYAWHYGTRLFQRSDCNPEFSFMCDVTTFDPHQDRECVILSLKPDKGETWEWKVSAASCSKDWYVLCQGKSIKGEAANARLMDEEEAEKLIMV